MIAVTAYRPPSSKENQTPIILLVREKTRSKPDIRHFVSRSKICMAAKFDDCSNGLSAAVIAV